MAREGRAGGQWEEEWMLAKGASAGLGFARLWLHVAWSPKPKP